MLSAHPTLSVWPLDPAVHVRSARVSHSAHERVLIGQSIGEAYKNKGNICFLNNEEAYEQRSRGKQRN